jgi:hypothetical protein
MLLNLYVCKDCVRLSHDKCLRLHGNAPRWKWHFYTERAGLLGCMQMQMQLLMSAPRGDTVLSCCVWFVLCSFVPLSGAGQFL